MKKIVLFALVLVCLLALRIGSLQQIKAQQSSSNITIGADGMVSPENSQIQQIGNSYVLETNITGNILVETSNITLDGNGKTLSGGIRLDDVLNIVVKNFVINGGGRFGDDNSRDFFCGLYLRGASSNLVSNNTIKEVTDASDFLGVFVYYDSLAGIIVEGGHSNTIIGNNLVNNDPNILFSNTAHNLLVGNTIIFTLADQKTLGYGYYHPSGIYFDESSNNTIYHNNFEIDLGVQAQDSYDGSLNIWDNGYPSGGNYWVNYHAQEIDKSGIGNTPHFIDGPDENSSSLNNTDYYPLIEPFNSSFYAMQSASPEISLLSPLNQAYDSPSVSLDFIVNVLSPVKTVSWIDYSLDGQKNVTVTGNITMTALSRGLHNITVYAKDDYGNIGSSEIINFTVTMPVTFPTTTVAPVSGVVAVVAVSAGLLVYFKRRKHPK